MSEFQKPYPIEKDADIQAIYDRIGSNNFDNFLIAENKGGLHADRTENLSE